MSETSCGTEMKEIQHLTADDAVAICAPSKKSVVHFSLVAATINNNYNDLNISL